METELGKMAAKVDEMHAILLQAKGALRKLANDWLPKPRILHPWPSARFAVRHPRWEPYARIGHVRFCAGGAQ